MEEKKKSGKKDESKAASGANAVASKITGIANDQLESVMD